MICSTCPLHVSWSGILGEIGRESKIYKKMIERERERERERDRERERERDLFSRGSVHIKKHVHQFSDEFGSFSLRKHIHDRPCVVNQLSKV